jgi:hypothetical protein
MWSLEHELETEDRAGLWTAEVGGVHLWPLIRWRVLQLQSDRHLGMQAALRRYSMQRAFSRDTIPGAMSLLAMNARRTSEQCNALVIGNTALRHVIDGRRSFDRVHAPYCAHIGRTLMLQRRTSGAPTGREVSRDLNVVDIEQLWWYAAYKAWRRRLGAADRSTIRAFAHHVGEVFGQRDCVEQYDRQMRRFIGMYPTIKSFLVQRIFPRLRQRHAFVYAACTMAGNGLIVQILHEHGFRVHEAQHGWLGRWHSSYQYGQDVLERSDHPARRYLPDSLLVFGPYWAEQARVPMPCHVVGYPLLTCSVARLNGAVADPDKVLVVSQGSLTDRLCNITRALAEARPDVTVLYKLHPQEPNRAAVASLRSLSNVQVIARPSAMDLLARCQTIIGGYSTTLFEACAFPDRRAFYLESPLVPPGLGASFASADELVEKFDDPAQGRPVVDREQFWASDWAQRLPGTLSDLGIETAIPVDQRSTWSPPQ